MFGFISKSQPSAARDEQRHKLILILVGVLAVAGSLAAGFYLGQEATYRGTGMDPKSYLAREAELNAVQATLHAMEGELEAQRTRYEVAVNALELVRREIATQKEKINGLEEVLRFYRSLMAPGEIAKGLSLREIELVEGREPRQYLYRIVVQQKARKHELLTGELKGLLFGLRDGEQVEYELAQLSDGIEGDSFPLQFRYFQSVEGRIVLPEGFKPVSVSVVARTLKPHKREATREFAWQLQEKFTDVGK